MDARARDEAALYPQSDDTEVDDDSDNGDIFLGMFEFVADFYSDDAEGVGQEF